MTESKATHVPYETLCALSKRNDKNNNDNNKYICTQYQHQETKMKM